MTDTLQPCPFCGTIPAIRCRAAEKGETSSTREVWSVTCYGGKTNAHAWFYADTQQALVAAWNRRPTEDAAQAPSLEGSPDEWPKALARLQNTEPHPDQGIACVGTQDLAIALERLHQYAEVALGNAAEIGRLKALLNAPETADFLKGVSLEMPHQRERWGADHDAGKDALDWVWLLGHLVNKAARSALDGDTKKAQHHTISSAAALGNWHAAIAGQDTRMRPGVDAAARGWEG